MFRVLVDVVGVCGSVDVDVCGCGVAVEGVGFVLMRGVSDVFKSVLSCDESVVRETDWNIGSCTICSVCCGMFSIMVDCSCDDANVDDGEDIFMDGDDGVISYVSYIGSCCICVSAMFCCINVEPIVECANVDWGVGNVPGECTSANVVVWWLVGDVGDDGGVVCWMVDSEDTFINSKFSVDVGVFFFGVDVFGVCALVMFCVSANVLCSVVLVAVVLVGVWGGAIVFGIVCDVWEVWVEGVMFVGNVVCDVSEGEDGVLWVGGWNEGVSLSL